MATTQTIPEFFLLTSNVFWETSPVFLGNIRCFLGTGSYALGNT